MKLRLKVPTKTDELASVIKGALIAGGSVALTYFAQNISATDFNAYGPVVVGVMSIAINLLRKSIGVESSDPVRR